MKTHVTYVMAVVTVAVVTTVSVVVVVVSISIRSTNGDGWRALVSTVMNFRVVP